MRLSCLRYCHLEICLSEGITWAWNSGSCGEYQGMHPKLLSFLEEKVVSIYLVALCVSWLHIQICKCVCVYAYVSVNVGMQTLAAFHPAWLLWHICFWQVNTHMLTPKSLSSTSSPSISLLGCFGPVFLLLNFISLICNFFFCVCTAFQSVVKVWLYETQ